MRRWLAFLFIFLTSITLAEPTISLDLQHVNLPDALRIIAKFLDKNIIISSSINGQVSLHLQNVPAQAAFDFLLNSQHLAKQLGNNIWLVVPRAELIQTEQEKVKLQEAVYETASLLIHVWQIHYAKADDIGRLIQDNNNSMLSKRGHVWVDSRTNSLCVQDIAERINDIQHLIKRLDIPVQQVLIAVRLANIDYDFERALGIHFSAASVPDPAVYSLAVARLANGSLLDMQLSALEKAGHGELISNPRLFTANQQTAEIETGEEIPYQEISRSGATGVAFKKAVLSLQVTPQVMPGNQVLLQLQVNQDKPSDRIILGVPAIATRQMRTHILIKDGQTIVLGGIYESDKENIQQSIPFLGKIPVVGWLFQQQNINEKKRELLIFVTPKIIPQE